MPWNEPDMSSEGAMILIILDVVSGVGKVEVVVLVGVVRQGNIINCRRKVDGGALGKRAHVRTNAAHKLLPKAHALPTADHAGTKQFSALLLGPSGNLRGIFGDEGIPKADELS